MALQAFIDDSMQANQVLVMAGFISTAEKWSSFSDEWRQALTMSPRIERFKMSEVDMSSERQMERLRYLYSIIEANVEAQVAVALNCGDLAALIKQFKINPILSNPYYLAHKAVVNLTGQLQKDIGIRDPIDFVFDRRMGEEETVSAAFAHYMGSLPDEYKGTIANVPIFRDDADFMPLQAADFLAWWVRRWWLHNGGALGSTCVAYPWAAKRQIPSLILDFGGRELFRELEAIELHEHLSARRRSRPRWPREWPMTVRVTFSCDLDAAPET